MLYFQSPAITRNWKNPTFPSKSELPEGPLCLSAILFYAVLKAATVVDHLFSQCLFPPFLCHSWPCTLHHYIKHYQTVNSPREAITTQTPENPDTISQYGNLALVFWYTEFNNWLISSETSGFCSSSSKNAISLLKGQMGEASVGISATQISLQF